MSFDHIGINTGNYDAMLRFYEAALAPLGIKTIMSFNEGGKTAGLGDEQPFLWIGDSGKIDGKLHLAFTAKSRDAVDAFHAAALANGGKDNGAPGVRPHYHANYYAAFVFDPDGHNIEAVCHAPA